MIENKFERCSADYEDLSARFLMKTRTFRNQYAHIYSVRLQLLRERLSELAIKKWGGAHPIKKLFELDSDNLVVIIGTLYKEMKLKPNILKEISEEHYLTPQPVGGKYTAADDVLILEDDLQRIVLRGNIDINSVVTGVVVALLGQEQEGGKFLVKDTLFNEPTIRPPLTLPADDRYVCLVSGFEFTNNADSLLSLQTLVDLLTGHLGDAEKMAKVVRVIVAGGSVSCSPKEKSGANKAKYLIRSNHVASVEVVRSLDVLLAQLSSNLEVDLMPGEFDPSNHLMPQQPFHPCMFPLASSRETFRCVTNPYDASVAGVRFLGTSGQNVDDVFRYSGIEDGLLALESTFKWGHLAPTAPDTLGMYPFYDDDPFIITDCPHLYFAGCQPKFQSKLRKDDSGVSVVLVTIPKFVETRACVLFNLRTLRCEPLVLKQSLQ